MTSLSRALYNRIKTSQKNRTLSYLFLPVKRSIVTSNYSATRVIWKFRKLYMLQNGDSVSAHKTISRMKEVKHLLMLTKFPKQILTQVKVSLHTCLALQEPGEKEKHLLCQTKDIALCFCGNLPPHSPS